MYSPLLWSSVPCDQVVWPPGSLTVYITYGKYLTEGSSRCSARFMKTVCSRLTPIRFLLARCHLDSVKKYEWELMTRLVSILVYAMTLSRDSIAKRSVNPWYCSPSGIQMYSGDIRVVDGKGILYM